MDAIPFYVLLAPLVIMGFFAGIFLFFNIFHLARYGVEGKGTAALIIIYMALFVSILGISTVLLEDVPWGKTFSLTELLPSSSKATNFGL